MVDQILRGICDLASGIEAVERKYVKKGQRLLFCGPDLLQLGAKCLDLQHAFDALLQGMSKYKESSAIAAIWINKANGCQQASQVPPKEPQNENCE